MAVVGTATEVGKTWVAARLLEALTGRGVAAAARKPVQSYEAAVPAPTDADVLGAATGEDPADVCPPHRWLPVAMAPPMAADVLGLTVPTIGDLVAELVWPTTMTDVGLVETVGGVRAPMGSDGDSVDLVRQLAPDLVVLVADAGLGTINSVRLSMGVLDGLSVLVHLNRFEPADDLHRRNQAWLAETDGYRVTTTIDDLVGLMLRAR